ncbi:MAG: diguanylate cyclase [Solirubrobacterales bacterium]|nr:diguanylate cyclase [Solirubrobacterales bacterium]
MTRSDPAARFIDRLPGASKRGRKPRSREAAERDALLRVAAAVAGANDLEGVVDLAAEEALKAIGAASLTISRFEAEGARYRTLINVGQLSDWEERHPANEVYEVEQYPGLREMSRTANPYFNSVDDPDCDPATRDFLISVGKTSDLGVAIVVEGEIWGGIWATTIGKSSFQAEDVRFLEAIGGQVAAAIARAELFSRVSRLAYEDPLTGLSNRRALEERLERALIRHAAGESTVALMLCDADRLKQINDEHGHAGGDRALRNVAQALVSAAAVHPGSFVARLGGDEFCVLLESLERIAEGTELGAIEEIAADAQAELASLRPHVTLSCGAATATARTATVPKLMRAADTAQYVAKRRGGNRICTAAQIADVPNPFTVAPLRGGTLAERITKATEGIGLALNGELARAPTLDRLEHVAIALTEAAGLAVCSVSLAATGSDFLRELSQGDNRDPRSSGVHVIRSWEEFERYELDLYPETARIINAGSGWFTARIGDEASDQAERAMLQHEGFEGVVAAAAGDDDGVYLVELFSDDPASDLQSLAAPLALSVAAAIPRRPHRRSARSTSASERALGLTLAVADRLARATAAPAVCEAAVQELQRAFECTVVHLVSIAGDQLVLQAECGVIDTPPGWTQAADVGLIGRCIRERGTVIALDVNREPQYRATRVTRDVRSELVVPIYDGYDVWGAINLEDVQVGAFGQADARLLESVAAQIGGALTSIRLYEQLDRAYVGTAEALSAALEAKDSYTAEHSKSIAENAVAVGRLLGWRGEELRMLRYAAAFHDIGKLGISRGLLNKPGPLTKEEWDEMAEHTLIGERILAPIEFLAPIRPIVRNAHERWDGEGYPDGLAGEEIPLGARILFACDAYDAMTSDRTYRDALPTDEARRELRREAGKQFDPVVVDALLMVLESADEKVSRPRLTTPSTA